MNIRLDAGGTVAIEVALCVSTVPVVCFGCDPVIEVITVADQESAMNKKFDLVALGTGSAASGVASKCRSAGWQVAMVDSRPFGGTCALRGCDPKKVLVGAADVVDWLRRMEGKGIRIYCLLCGSALGRVRT